MNRKMTIVLIALIGIGLYALPSTVALFSGQHTFVNIDPAGNQIACVKCHGDVKTELTTATGTNSVTGTPSAHAAFKCEYCHRVEAGKASGDNTYVQITYKNATATADGVSVYRKVVLTTADMEARNIPTQMTPITTYAQLRVLPTISGKPIFRSTSSTGAQISVSTCYPDTSPSCTTGAVVLIPPADLKTLQVTTLYTGTPGVPKDPNEATRYGIFDASKVNWTEVNDGLSNNTWNINLTGAGSRSSNPGSLYHAASLVSCFECHGGTIPNKHHDAEYGSSADCAGCHYVYGSKGILAFIDAGGFGLTGGASDTGTLEAHNEFVTTTDGGVTRFDRVSNGACVACHTHVAVDITYNKPSTYKFDVNFWTDGTEELDGFGAQPPMKESHSP